MSKTVYASAAIEFDVQFYDVDSMRVVWHGNYVKYLEKARCELLKGIGYNYLEMEESGYLWPIVDMRLKYVSPAQFAQIVRVEAKLVEYESRMKIEYIVSDAASGQVLNKATTVQVAVKMETGEMMFESPAVLKEKIKA